MKIKILFSILLLSGLAFTAYQFKLQTHHSPAVQFKNSPPFYGDIQQEVSTTATIEPQTRLEVKPPINGRIEEILFKEGEEVKAGQTLAWMSSTERAALLDTARSDGKNKMNYWNEVYKPTPIISPVNGRIIVKSVDPGQTVTQADSLFVISDRLIIKAEFDETDIGKIKIGQKAIITLDAYPELIVNGYVDHINYESEVVNNVTIYAVEILPDSVPDEFRSGMSATVQIIRNKKEHILLLSSDTLIERDGSKYVWLRYPDMGPLESRRVETGLSDEKNVEILSGLSEKDPVVIQIKIDSTAASESGVNPFMPFRPPHDKRKQSQKPKP